MLLCEVRVFIAWLPALQHLAVSGVEDCYSVYQDVTIQCSGLEWNDFSYGGSLAQQDSVCLSVTDVTPLPQRILWERGYKVYSNTYSGNESPNCR